MYIEKLERDMKHELTEKNLYLAKQKEAENVRDLLQDQLYLSSTECTKLKH